MPIDLFFAYDLLHERCRARTRRWLRRIVAPGDERLARFDGMLRGVGDASE